MEHIKAAGSLLKHLKYNYNHEDHCGDNDYNSH